MMMAQSPSQEPPERRKHKDLLLLSLGYGGSMLAFRGTLMMSLPTMLDELHLTTKDGGMVLSASQIAYMVAKPVMQTLSDHCDARTLLLGSEAATAMCMCFFSIGVRTLRDLEIVAAALLVCQAPHPPAAARLLTARFKPHERGTAFSVLNGSTNLVSCALPFIIALGIPWRRLYVAIGAVLGLITTIQALFLTKDDDSDEESPRRPSSFVAGVFSRGIVWVIGTLYALLSFVRMGIEAWIGTYFHHVNDEGAPAFLFWWQLGGFAGASFVGPMSDARWGGYPGTLSTGLGIALLCLLPLLSILPSTTYLWLLNVVALAAGACVYAIKVCLTLSTRLYIAPRDCGKADALTNALAELGGACAGLPLISILETSTSWVRAYGVALTTAAAALCVAHAGLLAGERSRPRHHHHIE